MWALQLVHTADTDKTRQFCLVSIHFPFSKFSVVLNIFETEQLQIENWVKTRQNCFALLLIVLTLPTQIRQHSLVRVRVGEVNKLLVDVSSNSMLSSERKEVPYGAS